MKPGSFIVIALFLAFIAAVGLRTSTAQTLTSGDITGTITDPSGAVLPNLTVTLQSNDQGFTKTTTTNARGFYRFSLLPPGSYTISVAAPGFQKFTRQTNVTIGQAAMMNAQLALATSGTTVEVTGAPGVIQTENGNVSTTFSQEQVALVPNPGNDLSYIAQTAPGAVMNTQAGYGNFSTFGLPGTSNLFTYNGQNENDPYFNLNNSGATNLLLGSNDVREVTVVNNGYSGQYGGLAGANVNYVSKSGSNAFHGNAQYFWNGRIMNANNYFNKQSTPVTDRPFVNANQWAASIGGPIRKDKTFFFVDTEGLRVLLPVVQNIQVPSPQFQRATLDNLAAANPAAVPFYTEMFNLYNGAKGVNTATPVPGGGCADLSNAFTASGAPCALAFNSNTGQLTTEWLLTARLDQNIGTNDKVFIHFRTDHGNQASYTDPINPAFNAISEQPQYEGQLNETHTFGTSAVNQLIISGSWYSAVFAPSDIAAATRLMPFALDFAGTALGSTFYGLGHDLNLWPQGRNITQYQLVDDLSLTRGNHTFKFGVNFARNDITDFSPQTGTIGDAFGETLTSFFNGSVDNFIQTFPTRLSQPVAVYSLGLYAQDEWRVTPNLKLTLALRADHNSNPVCQTDCFARLADNFFSIAHDPNVPYNQAIRTGLHEALPDLTNIEWQPRFGFAFTPFGQDSNTVFRGGFGLFADRFPGFVADLFMNNPPLNNQFITSGSIVPTAPDFAGTAAAQSNVAFVNGFNSGLSFNNLQAIPGFLPPNIGTPARKIHNPRYQEWNFELEQGIGQKMSLSLNYVGSHGIWQPVQNAGVNAFCDATCLSDLGAPFFVGLPGAATDPRFGTVTQVESSAVSNYNGLTVSLQRRMSSLQWQLNYTWSHALDEISNGGFLQYNFNTNVSVLTPQNPFNLRQNYGNADYDIRHNLNLNYVWDVPFKFNNGLLNQLLGGWSVAGTLYWRSGLPFTVIDSNATALIPNFGGALNEIGAFIFANWNGLGAVDCGAKGAASGGPCLLGGAAGALNNALGIANFTPAVTGFGNQRRNQLYGPRFFDTDLGLTKNFKIPGWESGRFGVGAQFFNILNHPNFDQPIGDVTASRFGQITKTVNPPTSIYGSFLGGDASPRTIQLRAQITF